MNSFANYFPFSTRGRVSPSPVLTVLPPFTDVVLCIADSSRLVLHITSPSAILSLLTQYALSPSLAHIKAHPPELLIHLASAYLTPPPPASPPTKFWAVFVPFSEREYESDRLVFGVGGEGCGGGASGEIVIEIVARGGGGGRKRRPSVERVLEGWSSKVGACELRDLPSLRAVWARKVVAEVGHSAFH